LGNKTLFEFNNVLDATYGAYIVNGAYTGIGASDGDSKQIPMRDQAVANIRDLLVGKTATVRKSAKDTSTAISTIQVFTDTIETIAEKLIKMLELARKALESYQSQMQIEEMNKQFRNLALEINQIANSTEYKFNKPFSGSGSTISIPAGNGTIINIFARDFRLDTQDLNIETDPQGALSKLNDATTKVNEYKTYLYRQASHLRDITAAIELEIQDAMGVEMQDFQPELAAPMADYAASLILQDKLTSINTQANLTPYEILKLLK
jgi:flagellin-like hook-associated protein FlgL